MFYTHYNFKFRKIKKENRKKKLVLSEKRKSLDWKVPK